MVMIHSWFGSLIIMFLVFYYLSFARGSIHMFSGYTSTEDPQESNYLLSENLCSNLAGKTLQIELLLNLYFNISTDSSGQFISNMTFTDPMTMSKYTWCIIRPVHPVSRGYPPPYPPSLPPVPPSFAFLIDRVPLYGVSCTPTVR